MAMVRKMPQAPSWHRVCFGGSGTRKPAPALRRKRTRLMNRPNHFRRSTHPLTLRAFLLAASTLATLSCGADANDDPVIGELAPEERVLTEQIASARPNTLDAGIEGQPSETLPTAMPALDLASRETGRITDRKNLSQAVIRVVAAGALVEPGELLEVGVAGSGSGFIIDSSGLAVTNNHVVTGASILQVFVGESTEPVNARIVGVSECNDLAVIDLAGDGYRYLEWSDEAPSRALDVLSVGYPLGDPSLTETEGILSKEEGPARTSFAAADLVLEHTARILPGNSGGPLLSLEDLRVVGVNFAVERANDTNFALSVNLAHDVVEQLQESGDFESVGINGVAVRSDELTGVWVRSVKAGSPADVTGVQAGDLVVSVGGLSPAADGTLGNYCDVIRTQGSDATIDVELLRPSTSQVLEGQFNGRALAENASPNAPESTPELAPNGTAPPTNVDWFVFSDGESEQQCDLINGVGFQAVVLSPSGELMMVGAGQDVPDQLTGLFLDDAGNLVTEEEVAFARLVFAEDANGNRRSWLTLIDGSLLGAEPGSEPRFPDQFANVGCDACGLVDSPEAGICD